MKREFLQELGLDKDVIEKIMTENGNDINAAKQDEANLKEQLDTANQTITGLKAAAEKYNGEELTQRLEELQGKYETDVQTLQKDLHTARFNGALEAALVKSGAKNTKALRGLLDMDKLAYQDGTLSGFEEQIEQIKQDNDFLFAEPKGWGKRHAASAPQKTGVEEAFAKLNPQLKVEGES